MRIPVLYQIECLIKKLFKTKYNYKSLKHELDILRSDLEIFKEAVKNTDIGLQIIEYKSQGFWVNQKNWSIIQTIPERGRKQTEFILNNFVPLLKKEDIVCDLASASGDFSFLISPYVNKIDAYEISPGMVEYSKKLAEEKSINNIDFMQADAKKHLFNKVYDNFMCLGLFTCIEKDSDCVDIISKIAKALKNKGYLVIKDTVNLTEQDSVYEDGNYMSFTRNIDKYLNFYYQLGFKLIAKDFISDGEKARSLVAVLEKNRE